MNIWYCPKCGEFQAMSLGNEKGYIEYTICPSCGGLVGYPEDKEEVE